MATKLLRNGKRHSIQEKQKVIKNQRNRIVSLQRNKKSQFPRVADMKIHKAAMNNQYQRVQNQSHAKKA